MTRRLVVAALTTALASGPVCGQVPAARVSEVLSIGAVDGPLESTFSRVVGIEVASTGEILIADRGENSIRVFSPTGEFVRAFGRAGGGPSEFRALATTGMLDDTLYVLDWHLQKIAAFSLDGTLIQARRVNYSPGQHGLIYRIYPLRSGDLVLESGSGCNLPRRPGLDSQWWLLFLAADGEDLTPIRREDLGQSVPVYGTEEDMFCTSFSFPFGAGPMAAVRPDGVVVYGTGETESVHFFQLPPEGVDSVRLGRAIAEVALPGGRRSIGHDERARWIEQQVAPLSGDAVPSKRAVRVREVLEDVPFPKEWPAYDRLQFDAEGGIWVRRPPEIDAQQATWDVYSPGGQYRGLVELPAALQVRRIGQDAVYGVVRDDWGVQYVKKYSFRWNR